VAMEKAKVVLGGDPEFGLVREGVFASVADLLRGEVELPWGVIGRERELLELRPWPSVRPETLVKNIGHLLLEVPRVVGGVPSTVCRGYPLGGHVHIGGVPGSARGGVVKAVDEALGDLFYSLNAENRLWVGYGKRGDWRPQPWGVEYRTPPASLWSHPGVALVFLRAIKWVVEKFLSGEEPLKDLLWPTVRASAERAAEFVREHGGRLHWGAWKEYVGEFDLRLVERAEEEGGDFLVREAVPLSVDWPPELEAEEVEGDWEPGSEAYACHECGVPVPYPELHRDERGRAYCPECWEEEYASCRGCGRTLRRFQARHDRNGRAYCEECYDSFYVICSLCDVEVAADEARFDEVGEAYCEDCYLERYTLCEECGREVARDEVEEVDGLSYCPSCYASLEEDG